MKWTKRGVIYKPDGCRPWARHSALQPTPLVLGDRIRVFIGLRDANGVSSVGWVDLDPRDPSRVIGECAVPALSKGIEGAFDERGVVPCAVVTVGDEVWLYYAGYQLPRSVRFFVFGGLAISRDEGTTFARARGVPLLDRTDDALFFRVAHTVMRDGDLWRVWYGGGSEFREGAEKSLPVYDIRYMESRDPLRFPEHGEVVIPLREGEHRVGRPYVIRRDGGYLMFYGSGTEQQGYRLGYAESADGQVWTRRDEDIGIDVSPDGWDSETIGYPAVVTVHGRTFLFYNGNGYGKTGFGYAELEAW
jgi:hypothetical protein